MEAPSGCCVCASLGSITGLYQAILVCLRQYRSRFDSAEYWYDAKRFDRLNPVSTTERMLREIRSSKIEKVAIYQKSHILKRF